MAGSNAKYRLIYGFDPICGWCYGFAPALDHIRSQLPDLTIELRLGGLVTGPRVGPLIQMANYITQASEHLLRVTGRKPRPQFFNGVLTQKEVISNSAPPSKAILWVRKHAPDREIDFAKHLQEVLYTEGRSIFATSELVQELQSFGIQTTAKDLESADLERDFAHEVQFTRSLGINSFPTLQLWKGENPIGTLPSEYRPAQVVQILESAMNQSIGTPNK